MAKLSVNINKLATLRNSRGGNNPDVVRWALQIERFGADGITVHPRPDERHIRYRDVIALKEVLTTELNIEGNPYEQKFIDLVLQVKPAQVTLVPDAAGQLTSDHGWDIEGNLGFLQKCIHTFKSHGIRTSIFVDAREEAIKMAPETGTDRIELYTEQYAAQYTVDKHKAILPFEQSANLATSLGLGVNAGHDLSLENLAYFNKHLPSLLEVSIGHALVCDALVYGMENTIQLYQRCLKK
jgi:pyridoxine 5-phosphate synthase